MTHSVVGLILGFTSLVASATMHDPLVTVTEGRLQGAVKNLLDGNTYYSFKGIPYAEPPVGPLRFRDPRPPKPWEGIRNATEHGEQCPQFEVATEKFIEGNEDCLFLNVYTKTLNPTSKTPVMVFIHGGSFMSGSGNDDTFGPEFLLQHDVILITINYRLEVLGFLSLDTAEVPGNAGMKDQVLALRWIKKNIAKFGGDPDNITIFGESSGSTSVIFHMFSPMAEGLFHKALGESEVLLSDWAQGKDGRERAFRVGKLLGNTTKDINKLLDFLRSVPAIKLARVTFDILKEEEMHRGFPIVFTPVIEKQFEGVEAFLTEEPIPALLSKRIAKVPLMIGYNNAEGIITLNNDLQKLNYTNAHSYYLVPWEISRRVPEKKTKEFGENIIRFYSGKNAFTSDDGEGLINLRTDLHFSYDIQRFVYAYSKFNSRIYLYRFGYDTDLNVVKNLSGLNNYKGASHADEMFYIFYSGLNKDVYEQQPKLKDIVFKVTKLWADFARTGNPTPDSGVTWQPYSREKKEFYNIVDSPSVGEFADRERMEFWNRMYCEANTLYIKK